jgi:DNA-binding SARP family transcriptional activator/TolB-like protein
VYKLSVLGAIDLRQSDEPVRAILAQPKRLALLAYLVCARSAVRRDKLLALFWPESDEHHARKALNQSVHTLRRALGPHVIVVRGAEDIGVDATLIECDAIEMLHALEEGNTRKAISLYNGPFFDGFFITETPELTQWIEEERSVLQKRITRAAWDEVDRLFASGQAREALELATRAHRWASPFDESSFRHMLQSYDRAGDRAAALRSYEEFKRQLQSEYDAEPGPETEQLVAAIRARSTSQFETPAPGPVAVKPAAAATKRVSRRIVAFAVLIVLAVGAAAYRTVGVPSGSLNDEVIAVFPFTYRGNEDLQYLGEGATNLIETNLTGSGMLRSIDPRALTSSLDTRGVTATEARKVARRFGSGTAIIGEVTEVGGQLRLAVTMIDPRSRWGKVDVEESGTAAELFDMAERASRRLLAERDLANPPGNPYRMTRSLPALRAFVQGESNYRAGRYEEAEAAFRRAVQADSMFAIAYLRLSMAANWTGSELVWGAAVQDAMRLSQGLPRLEQLRVRAWDAYLAGYADRAEPMYRKILEADSNNVDALFHLADLHYHWGAMLGIPVIDAMTGFQRVVRIDPRHAGAWTHLARGASALHDREAFDSARVRIEALQPAAERLAELKTLHAFAFGDDRARNDAVRELSRLARPQVEGIVRTTMSVSYDLRGVSNELVPVMFGKGAFGWSQNSDMLYKALADVGRGRVTRAMEAIDSAELVNPWRAFEMRANLAMLPFPFVTQADRKATLDHMTTTPSFATELPGANVNRALFAGLLALRLNDTTRAHLELRRIENSREIYTRDYGKLLKAEILRQTGRPAEALAALGRPAGLPDLILPTIYNYSKPYERYLRGELHAELGQTSEAIRWLSTFPEPGGTDILYIAPAQLRLADVHERAGQTKQAREHLARFISLWNEADPALSAMVEAANRRLLNLR